MRRWRAAALALAGAASLALSACGPTGEVDTPGETGKTGETSQAVDSLGKRCHGTCANGTVHLCFPNITANCREQIVDACHRRGLYFTDAYWSYWGCG